MILRPFPKGYTIWLRHGETSTLHTTVETPTMPQPNEDKVLSNDPICDMANDAFGPYLENNDNGRRQRCVSISKPNDAR